MINYGLRVRRKCIYSCNMYEKFNEIMKKSEWDKKINTKLKNVTRKKSTDNNNE